MSIMLHITYNYALQTLCGAPHNVCEAEGYLAKGVDGIDLLGYR